MTYYADATMHMRAAAACARFSCSHFFGYGASVCRYHILCRTPHAPGAMLFAASMKATSLFIAAALLFAEGGTATTLMI